MEAARPPTSSTITTPKGRAIRRAGSTDTEARNHACSANSRQAKRRLAMLSTVSQEASSIIEQRAPKVSTKRAGPPPFSVIVAVTLLMAWIEAVFFGGAGHRFGGCACCSAPRDTTLAQTSCDLTARPFSRRPTHSHPPRLAEPITSPEDVAGPLVVNLELRASCPR